MPTGYIKNNYRKKIYLNFFFYIGFTGTLCESAPTIIPTTIATTVPTTTQPAYILCTNQNTCKNQGVCYIVINSVTCVCPQGK